MIIPHTHRDKRGYFFESFRGDMMTKYDLPSFFIQDNQSKSDRGTLRGLHYQLKYPQGKLVRVSFGKVYDVAVDIRKGSPTFGQYYSTILSDENHMAMFIPEGFAHAYYSCSKLNIIYYKLSNYYHPEYEDGIIWNDDSFRKNWPTNNPIVSKKDRALKTFLNFKKIYKGL